MNSKLAWVTFALAALSGAACDTNRSGNIRATVLGDMSHALSPDARASTMANLRANCDVSVPAAGGKVTLRRRPYLQRLTSESVRVAWTTDGQTDAAGTTAEMAVLVKGAVGGATVARAIAARDGSAAPPQRAVLWISTVAGLAPDTTYCYEVQLEGVPLRRGGFRTAPAAGSDRAISFVALGDSGSGSADQDAVTEQLQTVPFDFMLHLGDIGYETGSRANIEDNFFGIYADLLEDFAVFPASGNHEYETEDAAPFREAFVLPENGGPQGVERWYSYDWGNVHLVALDTERTGPVQAAWLDADLGANKLPWTIVYFHRPPFSSGDHGNDGNVQKYFVPLFVAHHVPLVLNGHDHDYERTNPIDGVTYIVSGGGGRGTRPVGRSAFTAFSEEVCHFIYVTVEGRDLTVHAIDGVGKEFDSVAISLPAPL